MAIAKKAPGKTIKHNPPARKKSSTRRTASRARSASHGRSTTRRSPKRNPSKAQVKRSGARSTGYRRNPSDVTNVAMAAIGGALVLGTVDVVFATLLPPISAPLQIGLLGATALGLNWYGKKIPVIGAYAPAIGGALALLAAYIGVKTYLVPYVMSWIGSGTPAVTQEAVIKNDDTQQLGMRLMLNDGNYIDNFSPQANQRANELLGYAH